MKTLHTPLSHRTRPTRRAFSTMLMIASMIFILIAVMAMTTLFAHEARRTRSALAQTQLRQLLLAALPSAQLELQTNPATHDVTLPVPVEGATVTLHVQANTVRVQATYRGAKAAQTLTFADHKLAAASLDLSAI